MKQSENNERWPCKNTCVEHWKKKKKILNNQEMFGPTGYSGGKQVQSRWENQWLTNGKYSIHWWLKESPRMTLCTTVDIGGFGGYSRQKQKEAMEKKQGERAALFYTSPPTVCSLSLRAVRLKRTGMGRRRENRWWEKRKGRSACWRNRFTLGNGVYGQIGTWTQLLFG